jgi:hypothetical protein
LNFWHLMIKLPSEFTAVTGFLWWRYCEHKYCELLDEKIEA